MKLKKQIVIAIFMSLLLTSCSLNLKAGSIKHEDKNKSVEEVIKEAEEAIKKADEILKKEEKISEEEKNKLVVKVKNEINDILLELSEIPDEEKIKELLKEEFDNSNLDIENIYFATEKGAFYTYPEWNPPEEYNPSDRVWYTEAKEEGEYTTSYYDDIIDQEILSLSLSIKSGESFIGVLGVDINLGNDAQ